MVTLAMGVIIDIIRFLGQTLLDKEFFFQSKLYFYSLDLICQSKEKKKVIIWT